MSAKLVIMGCFGAPNLHGYLQGHRPKAERFNHVFTACKVNAGRATAEGTHDIEVDPLNDSILIVLSDAQAVSLYEKIAVGGKGALGDLILSFSFKDNDINGDPSAFITAVSL